jgi:dihydrofolate reductase
MRKIKLAIYVALDGVVGNPAWTGPFWSDELAALQREYLFSSDALLLGRVTYQGFAAAWPKLTDTGDFGERMNAMPKFVASRTLKEAEWNATIINGDLPLEVARLKQQPGQALLIYGSGDLVDELTRHRLIDEYRVMLYPVIVGSGKRFLNALPLTTLHLDESVTTSTGVSVITYTVAQEPAASRS